MFGAETLLMTEDEETFNQPKCLVHIISLFTKTLLQAIKKGGISTLEDKSLGCTQKAVKYGERLSVAGLNLLNAPGNDPIATSALAADYCVIHNWPRYAYGGFVPTLKIATNSDQIRKAG